MPKSKPENYVVLSNSEDGEVRLEVIQRHVLESRLNEGYWGSDPFFFSQGDVRSETKRGEWDFANSGPRGMVIFPLEAIVVPSPEEIVTRYQL